jgi:hypothetical protein
LALKGSSTETAASPLEPLIAKMVPGGVFYMGKVLVLELFWFARSPNFVTLKKKWVSVRMCERGWLGIFLKRKKFSRRFLQGPKNSPTVQTIYPMIPGGIPTCFMTGHRSKNTRKKKICEKFYFFFLIFEKFIVA